MTSVSSDMESARGPRRAGDGLRDVLRPGGCCGMSHIVARRGGCYGRGPPSSVTRRDGACAERLQGGAAWPPDGARALSGGRMLRSAAGAVDDGGPLLQQVLRRAVVGALGPQVGHGF